MSNRIKISLILLLFSSFLNTSLFAESSGFRVIGYIPNWIDVSAFANGFDFSQVTHINYAFQNPDANGNLIESNNGLTSLVNKAHANDVKVLVSLGGGAAAGGTTLTNYLNLINTSEKRAAFIHKIALYLKLFNLDGIDVDEEGPAINSNYGPFIKQLTDSLRPKGYLITAAVGWGGGSIPNATLRLFDFISLMSYDYTGYWDPSNPGQHSPYWYAQSMIDEYIGRGVDKNSIALGVPFYGYGFYSESGYQAYKDIINRFPEAYTIDKVSDTVYYNGTETIQKKTKLALSRIAGIMIWELSLDMTGDKSLLKVINETIDSIGFNGIDDLEIASDLRLYPNPTSDYLNIDMFPVGIETISIEVVDIFGRVVINQPIDLSFNHSVKMDVSGLKNGLYICRFLTVDHAIWRAFIKK